MTVYIDKPGENTAENHRDKFRPVFVELMTLLILKIDSHYKLQSLASIIDGLGGKVVQNTLVSYLSCLSCIVGLNLRKTAKIVEYFIWSQLIYSIITLIDRANPRILDFNWKKFARELSSA